MLRRTTPLSWYQPKLVVNRVGISFQWWWCWLNPRLEERHVFAGRPRRTGIPLWGVTLWFRWPPIVRFWS